MHRSILIFHTYIRMISSRFSYKRPIPIRVYNIICEYTTPWPERAELTSAFFGFSYRMSIFLLHFELTPAKGVCCGPSYIYIWLHILNIEMSNDCPIASNATWLSMNAREGERPWERKYTICHSFCLSLSSHSLIRLTLLLLLLSFTFVIRFHKIHSLPLTLTCSRRTFVLESKHSNEQKIQKKNLHIDWFHKNLIDEENTKKKKNRKKEEKKRFAQLFTHLNLSIWLWFIGFSLRFDSLSWHRTSLLLSSPSSSFAAAVVVWQSHL